MSEMWPWGHAAVGYLGYVAFVLFRDGRVPEDRSVWILVAGTQFPDVIDKPLAWTLVVLPAGRSLAHSLFTLTVVVGVLWAWTATNEDRDARVLVSAFGFGWGSHIVADGFHALWSGAYSELTYAVWPLLPLPAYETDPSFIAHVRQLQLTADTLAGIVLFVIACGVWVFLHSPWSDSSGALQSEADRT